ncbi:unnamed protein product [Rhodiola kirilowii]
MDFQSLPFLVISTFLFIMLVLFNLGYKTRRARGSALPLPPGPRKLPIIGNMHQLVGGLPHHVLRDMSMKHGPLMLLQLGEVPTIIVSSPEIAKEIMKTHDANFSDRPYFLASRIMSYDSKGLVISPCGDYWRQMRKLSVQELLSVKRVQSFRSIREEEMANLVRTIQEKAGQQVNFSEKIFAWTYSVTARAAFGKKVARQDEFINLITESTRLSSGFDISDMFPSVKILSRVSPMRPKLEKLHKQVDEILQGLIDSHVEHLSKNTAERDAQEGLLDVLLRFRRTGNEFDITLTDDHIKAVTLDLYSAASETSSSTVEWAMSEMLKNPNVMTRAQEEVRQVLETKGKMDETCLEDLHYLKAVIKETLRLHPPAPLLAPRESREKCEINGYQIPAKMRVLVNAYAIGRDPGYWNDADSFIPERFLNSKMDYKGLDFEYIPFGAGRRICPGMWMAMVNVALPLSQMLCRFDWSLADGCEIDMLEGAGFTVRRKSDLILIPTPYISP